MLSRALAKADIMVADVEAPGTLFWRFEMPEGIPVGYGGLEVHSKEALLRAVLTLPPARERGVGRAIVEALEMEAFIAGCGRMWAPPGPATAFLVRLGYGPAEPVDAPDLIRKQLEGGSSTSDRSGQALAKKLR